MNTRNLNHKTTEIIQERSCEIIRDIARSVT